MIESTAYNRINADAQKLAESWARIWKALDSGKDGEKEIREHTVLLCGMCYRNPITVAQETRERVAKVGPKARVKYLRQCQVAAKARGADAD